MTIAELAAHASPEAVGLARAILEQDLADEAWAAQIGPALAQRDVARLLGKSEQAVAKDQKLLRLRNRDGRPVYPVMQFEGRGQIAGIDDIVLAMAEVFHPLTVAAWLTGVNPALGDRRPVDALRESDEDRVLTIARQLAAASAA